MRKIISLFFACILIALSAARPVSAAAAKSAPEPPSWRNMDKEVLAQLLKRGELTSVDLFGPDKLQMCSIGVLANAPPEKVWKAITDFAGYGKLAPDFLTPEVLEKTEKTALVHFTVTVMKFSIITLATDFTIRYKLDAPRRADISWVSGKVKNVTGYWELFPVAGGKKTVVIYAITSDPASANPLVGDILNEQPNIVMAVNLTGAIIVARQIVKKAEKS